MFLKMDEDGCCRFSLLHVNVPIDKVCLIVKDAVLLHLLHCQLSLVVFSSSASEVKHVTNMFQGRTFFSISLNFIILVQTMFEMHTSSFRLEVNLLSVYFCLSQ